MDKKNRSIKECDKDIQNSYSLIFDQAIQISLLTNRKNTKLKPPQT